MSFGGCPVSRAVGGFVSAVSIICALLVKQYWLPLERMPHLTRDWQVWRVAAHPLGFVNSYELLLFVIYVALVLTQVERQLSSRKFASFLLLMYCFTCLLDVLVLMAMHMKVIAAGPFALMGASFVLFANVVPRMPPVSIGPFRLPKHTRVYALVFLLSTSQGWSTVVPSCVGAVLAWIYIQQGPGALHYFRVPMRIWRATGAESARDPYAQVEPNQPASAMDSVNLSYIALHVLSTTQTVLRLMTRGGGESRTGAQAAPEGGDQGTAGGAASQ